MTSALPWLLSVIKILDLISFALNYWKQIGEVGEAQEFIWILYPIQILANHGHFWLREVQILSDSDTRIVARKNIMYCGYGIFCHFIHTYWTEHQQLEGSLSSSLIFSLSLKSKTKKYETTMHIFPLLTNWYVAVCVWSCELEWVGNELFRAAAGVFLAALFHVLYCMHWIKGEFVGDGNV